MSPLSGIYFPLFTSIVPVYNVLQHGKYIINPDINKSLVYVLSATILL